LPRIGYIIKEDSPDSKGYKVANVEFAINATEGVCSAIHVTLVKLVGY
jgi:hypothetical protein